MKPETPLLTIAIPTYNRAGKLQKQIERLLPQLTPEATLCVYDNASPDATQETACAYQDRGVRYFRAKTNCGGERNFFRCFEECQTPWLWILGDDDPIVPDAVEQLLEIIRRDNCDYIQASSHLCDIKEDLVTGEVSKLFEHVNFSALLWLSTGAYKVGSFRPFFRLYNEAMSTFAPQALVVMRLLETGQGKAFLSSRRLTAHPDADSRITWSTLDFIANVSRLPEYLCEPMHQKLLAEKIRTESEQWALLAGLEVALTPGGIQRWKRIRRMTAYSLSSYGAASPLLLALKRGFTYGHRQKLLRALQQAAILSLFRYCPAFAFRFALTTFLLPKWLKIHLKLA